MMTDELIRSMKDQMVPSDALVSDLLSKISALDASPQSSESKVLSFSESELKYQKIHSLQENYPLKKTKKITGKPIWFYSTAAVASVIVLLSTFAVFQSNESSPEKLLTDIISNPEVASQPGHVSSNDSGNATTTPLQELELELEQDQKSPAQLSPWKNNVLKDESSQADVSAVDKNDSTFGSVPSNSSTSDSVSASHEKEHSTSGTAAPIPSSAVEDNGKVTPGTTGSSAISFSREILAESSVASLNVSGNNYVVEQTTTSADTSSEIQKICLDLPETSTTNEATVEAKVMKLKNVSSDLIVAVDVDGFTQTLLYTNENYSPETLGQFLSDSGLNKEVTFAKNVFCKGEKLGFSSYQRISVDNIHMLVEDCIFSSTDAPLAKQSSYENGTDHVTFKTLNNPTGSVINFGVSNNGYLFVKMASGKSFTFHIGENHASVFLDCVAAH